jgi:uncharacterized membrane protein
MRGEASVASSLGAGIRQIWPCHRAAENAAVTVVGSSRSAILRRYTPVLILVGLMAGYAVWFGLWSIRKYDAFQAPGFDVGIYDQGLWLLSHFKKPFVTILGLNMFGDHASFILVLLIPFYWIFPEPQGLLVVQAIALALGAIPVFLLGRTVLRNAWFALLPALAYLLAPALGWLNLENFHPDSLEVPLLLFALYFMTQARWRPYFVMVILLLTVKEDVPLVLIPLGIYIGLRYSWKIGAWTAGLSLVWFLLIMLVIQPALSGTGAADLDSWRIPFGGFGGLLATFFKRPWEVFAYMFTSDKLKYLFQLITPVLLLPLLTWRTLIVVPIVAFNLISTFWYQTNIQYHYTSLIIPVLCGVALLAVERFRSLKLRRVLGVGILLATLFSAYLWGPMPKTREAAYYPDPQHPQAVACAEAVALIPEDAVVAVGDKCASHLTHRETVYVFPTPFSATYWGDDSQKGQRLPGADDVEYIFDIPSILPEETLEVLAQMTAEGFVPIYDVEGVLVLKREAAPQDPVE